MIRESEVRKQLIAYLQGRSSLSAFEDWLVLHSWDMHRDSDASARELVASIELALSEYSSDHLSDDEFRSELGSLATNVKAKVTVIINGLMPIPQPVQVASPAYQFLAPDSLELLPA